MKKKNLEVQQVLSGEVKMDTQTMYHVNGDVNIYPCIWEDDKQVTDGGSRSSRGRMTFEQDGTSHFKAYRKNTGPRRKVLFTTRHGVVEKTRPIYRSDRPNKRRLTMESIYVTFRFPKNLGLTLTKTLYAEEADQILSYMKTLKEASEWEL